MGVNLGRRRRPVRLTRSELEELIQPDLERTIESTAGALRSAGTDPSVLWCLLLVGGSSRIPLVTELLTRAFRCRISLDTHPKHIVALGSARVASMHIRQAPTADPGVAVRDEQVVAAERPVENRPEPAARKRLWPIGVAASVVVAGSAVGWVVLHQPAPDGVEAVVTVDSRSGWADSGIMIEPGKVVRFTASGEFSDDQTRPNQLFTADGADRDPVQDVHHRDPYLQFPHAGLIGKIGADGAPFYIGRALRINDPQSGNIFLSVNDFMFTDNLGTLEVRVDIEDAP